LVFCAMSVSLLYRRLVVFVATTEEISSYFTLKAHRPLPELMASAPDMVSVVIALVAVLMTPCVMTFMPSGLTKRNTPLS